MALIGGIMLGMPDGVRGCLFDMDGVLNGKKRLDGTRSFLEARGISLPEGKPAPDMYVAGAEALGLKPSPAAVFEDALAGVAAGRAGGFGFVVGVDRKGQADALREHGADVVVGDLADLLKSEGRR